MTEHTFGTGAVPPVFVMGLSRSGTTLLARMLDAHSRIAIFPETWCFSCMDELGCVENFSDPWQYTLFLNLLWEHLCKFKDPAAHLVAMQAVRCPRYVGPARPILTQLGSAYAELRGAVIWGEKTPGHMVLLPQIHRLFPDARIVVSLRDPRDVVLSYDEAWGGNRRQLAFLLRCAATVRRYLSCLQSQTSFPSRQIHFIRYERLTSQPALVMAELCRFLGVDFEPAMINRTGASRADGVYSRHHKLVTKPVTKDRVGRFRSAFTPTQISALDQFLEDELADLGYPQAPRVKLSKKQQAAVESARRLNEQMATGVFRRRARQKAHLRLALYKWASPLMGLRGRQLAVTEGDWMSRVQNMPPPELLRAF